MEHHIVPAPLAAAIHNSIAKSNNFKHCRMYTRATTKRTRTTTAATTICECCCCRCYGYCYLDCYRHHESPSLSPLSPFEFEDTQMGRLSSPTKPSHNAIWGAPLTASTSQVLTRSSHAPGPRDVRESRSSLENSPAPRTPSHRV